MTAIDFLILVAVWCGNAASVGTRSMRSPMEVQQCREVALKCQSNMGSAEAMIDCFKGISYK